MVFFIFEVVFIFEIVFISKVIFIYEVVFIFEIIPVDQKKSIPLFGVLGCTGVFTKQRNRHIFEFLLKNLTIFDQNFIRIHCRKNDICKNYFETPCRNIIDRK